jgi:hypothetical protein
MFMKEICDRCCQFYGVFVVLGCIYWLFINQTIKLIVILVRWDVLICSNDGIYLLFLYKFCYFCQAKIACVIINSSMKLSGIACVIINSSMNLSGVYFQTNFISVLTKIHQWNSFFYFYYQVSFDFSFFFRGWYSSKSIFV